MSAAPRMAAPRMSAVPHVTAPPPSSAGPRFSAAPRIGSGPRINAAPPMAHAPSISRHAFSAPPSAARSFARPDIPANRSVAVGHAPASQALGVTGTTPQSALRNVPHGNLAAAAMAPHGFNAVRSANAVNRALTAAPVRDALQTTGGLRDPATRALVTASVATAAWHGFAGAHQDHWWRHRHGGFGWVGPVFWPFAYYDIYDYALWGDGYDPSFWDYGYTDLYAAVFDPYGYDDLIGYAEYLPSYVGRSRANAYASMRTDDRARPATLTQMCGDDRRDIAGLPTDSVAQTIQLNDEQRAALDELASASAKAAQIIKDSCPKDIALTAPARLAAMQDRIEAMIAAVQTVQPPLEKFYGLLNDEQKARLNALAAEQRPARRSDVANTATPAAGDDCGGAKPGLTDWPSEVIDRAVKPNDEQRGHLAALQSAAAKAADLLKTSCQPADALTPPARHAAAGRRLQTLLDAVKTVRPPLERFYASLSDEQKANFDAIGPQRLSSAEQAAPEPRVRHHHRRVRHGFNIERMIWRMMSMAR